MSYAEWQSPTHEPLEYEAQLEFRHDVERQRIIADEREQLRMAAVHVLHHDHEPMPSVFTEAPIGAAGARVTSPAAQTSGFKEIDAYLTDIGYLPPQVGNQHRTEEAR